MEQLSSSTKDRSTSITPGNELAAHTATSNRAAIFKGSKSFALASLFFTHEQKQAAWSLYRWCRFVDDEIDQFPMANNEALAGHAAVGLQAKLSEVRDLTKWSFATNPPPLPPAYAALAEIAKKYSINPQYALDLVDGLRMDVDGAHIEDEAHLRRYCYCVAGTVGLMMCSIMDVHESTAMPHALAMGRAMQLTNIARDIHEDLGRGRIYAPQTWLKELQMTIEDLKHDITRAQPLALQLLRLAEGEYALAMQGLRYLPWRASIAVASAGYIYRAIGLKIVRSPDKYLQQRATVSLPEKLYWVFRGLLKTIHSRLH